MKDNINIDSTIAGSMKRQHKHRQYNSRVNERQQKHIQYNSRVNE